MYLQISVFIFFGYTPRSGIAGSYSGSYFFFWPLHMACGILVPQQGMEPDPPTLEAQSLNHWTARGVTGSSILSLLKNRHTVLHMALPICVPTNSA